MSSYLLAGLLTVLIPAPSTVTLTATTEPPANQEGNSGAAASDHTHDYATEISQLQNWAANIQSQSQLVRDALLSTLHRLHARNVTLELRNRELEAMLDGAHGDI